MKNRLIGVLSFAIFIWAGCTLAQSLPEPLKVGSSLPQFEAQDLSGKKWTAADLKGKVVVFEWINPDCPFVRRHYREETFQKLVKKYADKIVWLSVNSTSYMPAEGSSNWVQQHKVSWPILLDQSGVIGKAFGARTTPHVFVFGADGKLAYQGAVDSDEYGTEKQRTQYLEQAIDAVLAGQAPARPETKAYGCSVKYKN